jgi:formylglycine-generating enzyme required for sulfatase activity
MQDPHLEHRSIRSGAESCVRSMADARHGRFFVIALCLGASLILASGAVLAQSFPPLEAPKQLAQAPEQTAELTTLLTAVHADMRTIPAGTFQMGDLSGQGSSNELPVHRVTLKGFRLAAHQITLAQYKVFVVAVAPKLQGRPRASFRCPNCDTQRVINVSWDDVEAFITWLNQQSGRKYRLATEAEWEYAVRAGSNADHPSGISVDLSQPAGQDPFRAGASGNTATAGPFSANAWGLYDVVGSVSEWTEDCWHDSYAGAPADGSAWASADCSRHVFRGGSWMGPNESQVIRVSGRSYFDAAIFNGHTNSGAGFRLAEDD